MARSRGENGSETEDQDNNALVFQADGAERINLPSTDFIAEATMTRQGGDLLLETADGQTVVIEGYFHAEPAPLLHGPDGSVLTQNLVDSFVRSPLKFAAGETANDESPVGAVAEVKGNATVTRADGTVETITNGTPIYQGDIVETDANGAVNILFLDETSMAVSANARLAIDEYTFDPATESGTTNFSVLRGLFVFTSGLIGRDDPDDVKIETPVGSIGIRGTIIAGDINPGGESNISVLEGAIVIKNGAGEITLSEQFETVRITSFEQPMQNMGVVPASDINARFSSIGDVNPSLFSVINDAATQEQPAPAPVSSPSVPDAPRADASSSNEQAPQQQTQAPPTPSQAPDVFTSLNDAMPSLDGTTSSGLPSAETIAGQPSSGLVPPTTAQPSNPATSSPATTQPPTTGAAPSNETPASMETPPAPPSSVVTSPPAATLPPPLTFTGGTLNDIAAANTVVGQLSPASGLSATTFSFADSGTNVSANGYYQMVANGADINVTLTTAGAQALSSSLDTVQLGGFGISVELDNGETITRTIDVTVTDANAGRILSLDTPTAGITVLSDSYENGTGEGRQVGYTISALGDINGDGFDDFIVSNDTNDSGQNSLYLFHGGAGYLPSGDITSTAPPSSIIPLPDLGGSTNETSVIGVGDFNGDGVVDYVVGQYNVNSGMMGSGNVTVINGANPSQTLSYGTGLPAAGEVGYSLSAIGDLNNDGYADVIIGAPGADSILLLNGAPTTWSGALVANNQNGATNSQYGRSVAGLGDFNGDGYSDYAVGAPSFGGNAGAVYIYRGGSVTGTLIGTITGNAGEMLGTNVSSVGDINGDGRTDLMIAGQNTVSLVFGTETTPMRNITFDLGGYTILGGGGVGDFNGDGYDDFVISVGDGASSKSYVVFGRDFPTSATYGLDFLKNPENAMEITYNGANNTNQLEISAIGDINGDGFDDFAIGVPDANGSGAGNGGLAIVYGRDTGSVTNAATATANNQSLVGTAGTDALSDGGFVNVSFNGGAGNDTFRISNTDFRSIDGGSGTMDTINAVGDLDFSNIDFEKISGIERISYDGTGQTLTLTLENLFNLMKTSDSGSLYIDTGSIAGNILNIDATTATGTVSGPGDIINALNEHGSGAQDAGPVDGYNSFRIGGYTLLIDQDLSVNIQ